MTSTDSIRDNRRSQSALQLAVLAGVVLAAFVLRIATLERRPLHFDEGNSVYFAQLSPPQLLQASIATQEADPPGYRLSLGLWIALAGPTPFALRLYSVFYGVLTVAALVALLGALGPAFRMRLLAAGVLAGAAFAVDYSQQAKGYAMGAAMALLSWWAWVRLMRGKRKTLFAGFAYVASTLLMLSTHYYTVALLAMQWLWWLGGVALPDLRRRALAGLGREALAGAVAQGIACAPIAVWTVLALDGIVSGASGLSHGAAAMAPWQVLLNILQEMSAGQFAGPTLSTIAVFVFVSAAIIGAARLWRAGQRSVFWFGVSFVIPLIGAMLLQWRIAFFYPRFLLYAMPSLCALAAGIAAATPRPVKISQARLALVAAGIAALFAVSAAGIVDFMRAPVDTANDFRPLFARMRLYLRSGDTALGSFIWMQGMLSSYAPETQGALRWHADFYSRQNVNELMAPIAQESRRIWLFNYRRNPDARETLSAMWLRRYAANADRFSAGTLSVLLFDTAIGSSAPTRHVRFGHRISLSYAPVRVQLHRGDTVQVTLNWQALQPSDEHVTVSLHLVAPDGRLVAQNDGDPVNGLAPSYTWQVGHVVVDHRALLVRDNLAPGDYTLRVGLYRTDNGARLTTDSGADAEAVGIGVVSAPGAIR